MNVAVVRLFDDRAAGLRVKTALIFAGLVGANIAAWIWTWIAFAGYPALLGTALLAYALGLRHAVDADHIAAIDNVVRKLMQEGKRPLTVGFFFALGHSTVVFLAAAGIALAASLLQSQLDWFKSLGGLIGTSVSALFLLAIGIANLLILRGAWTAFRRVRHGRALDAGDLDPLAAGGVLARMFRPVLRVVTRSWHMYPLGFLFGLGFDTATEIGLLAISAAQAAQGMPLTSTLVFPALFTAGMALVDTLDSVLMVGAYGWAFVNPVRKLWYNLTITAISVVVALLIGGIGALALIGEKLGLDGAFWDTIMTLHDDLANAGFVVIGVFVGAWIVSALIYRWKGYDRLGVGPAA
ncbi:HoxN/HupN/NixA family nickel/cobalt transporter [Benzoatithermus flavus]|uniref:Nickel/cobalt efflux system n=1 Tax=Benzoatithermus flavus TaxID=3108223 RepID=A0ABU8XRI0_9PROT